MSKTKTMLFSILLVALMASSVFAFVPQAKAKNISTVIPTVAYVFCMPNPVGLGQSVFITMWLDHDIPTAVNFIGDRWYNMTLSVTEPDGTTIKLGPYASDAAGGASVTWTPPALGNYTLVFNWPGQTLTGGPGYNKTTGLPAIDYPSTVGDVFGPSSSAPVYLTVGTVNATLLPLQPLPTGYWQCPVEAFNHNWAVLNGPWLDIGGLGSYGYQNVGDITGISEDLNPYTTAPLTAHVIWVDQNGFGGQIGLDYAALSGAAYTPSVLSESLSTNIGTEESVYYPKAPEYNPIVIINDRIYTTFDTNTVTGNIVCISQLTGQTLWTLNTLAIPQIAAYDILMNGQVYNFLGEGAFGTYAYLWAYHGTTWDCFDAYTGQYIYSVSGTPGIMSGAGLATQDAQGSLIVYAVGNASTTSPYLYMWNSTQMMNVYNKVAPYAVAWSPPQNAVIPYADGIVWTVPLPTSYKGVSFGNAVSTTSTAPGAPLGLRISGLDIQTNTLLLTLDEGTQYMGSYYSQGGIMVAGYSAGSNGNGVSTPATQIFIENLTVPVWTSDFFDALQNGIFAVYDRETLSWTGYSDQTGALLWGPTAPYSSADNPSAHYWGSNVALAYYTERTCQQAYGCFFTQSLGGQEFCFNMSNGNLVWDWSTGPSGENTPYGQNPLWCKDGYAATIADGVIYIAGGHEYGPPIFSGEQIFALNATTGQEIFQFLDFASGHSMPIADGILLTFNSYDRQLYAFGKGNSATTVQAPMTEVTEGNTVMITGTVTDQSPGQTCLGIPAKGTPCIADAYMSLWMEYLYEQSPEPTNATGVPITLTAIDPNGNFINIGTVTSDISGNFGYAWTTPSIPGKYTITATFAGTNSYYASSAETYTYVSTAPPTPAPTAVPPTGLASFASLELGIAAVIIVIIIIGAILAVLTLRKRP